jgi:hypothetical protein
MMWLIWLFPVLCTLHNVDEALTLAQWTEKQSFGLRRGKRTFRVIIVFITLLAFTVTAGYAWWPADVFRYGYFGYVGAMLINAFFPHVAVSVIKQKPMPGLVTAIINAVGCGGIIYWGLSQGHIASLTLIISTVLVGAGLLLIIAISFNVKKIIKRETKTNVGQ